MFALYEVASPIIHVFLFPPSGTRALNTNLHLYPSAPLSLVMLMVLSSACRVLFNARAGLSLFLLAMVPIW